MQERRLEFRPGDEDNGVGQKARGEGVVPAPEAQRRPFFTARTSVSGPRSPRNTNKNGGWERRELEEREAKEGLWRYGAKEENAKDGNQVPRDRGGREAEKGRLA